MFTQRFLIHSIVRLNPASNDVVASNPNSTFARLVSNFLKIPARGRRDWPLGFGASHVILSLNPQRQAIVSVKSLMLISYALSRAFPERS
jgi:hypothetical protein